MDLRYRLVNSSTDKHGVRRVVSACRVSPAGARKKVWVWRKQYHMATANGEPMVVLNDKTRFGTEYEHFPYHTEREAYKAAMALVPCEGLVPLSHYVIASGAFGREAIHVPHTASHAGLPRSEDGPRSDGMGGARLHGSAGDPEAVEPLPDEPGEFETMEGAPVGSVHPERPLLQ